MRLLSADEIKGRWKQRLGAAKIVWGRLTEDEWLALEGREQRLVGLAQERYAITCADADRAARSWLEKQKS